ncbi:hypothetical protein ACPVTF_10265 [Geobacillus icigianus]|uniref:Uncharacterized protein n=1 Tax=Geobacillus subterraneus TaxID=129338 RepID=A0A679FIR2_9BACL|nr:MULTISPECIES: hypothetical protein [Geobacillus]KYD27943.1 hypothetical protein B4113_4160 [Geobacillus sp. B4113_201601]BBW96048.1 hypothetical protein GsuE55_08810 [Geobacillus subterraneus]
MGRTKLGNANAQRNNNAKKKNDFNEWTSEFASYAEVEAEKMKNDHQNIR